MIKVTQSPRRGVHHILHRHRSSGYSRRPTDVCQNRSVLREQTRLLDLQPPSSGDLRAHSIDPRLPVARGLRPKARHSGSRYPIIGTMPARFMQRALHGCSFRKQGGKRLHTHVCAFEGQLPDISLTSRRSGAPYRRFSRDSKSSCHTGRIANSN